MEMESLSLNAGIALIWAVGVLFVLVIAAGVVIYRNWKDLREKNALMSDDIGKLQTTSSETNDALKQTIDDLKAVTDEVHQNDARWLEHQKRMLEARHHVYILGMLDHLDGMIAEVRTSAVRGVLDEKNAALRESSYKAAKSVVKSMSDLKSDDHEEK